MTRPRVLCAGDTVSSSMVCIILLLAPFQCGMIQICNIPEYPVQQEVFFHKSNQPFCLSLGKGMQ